MGSPVHVRPAAASDYVVYARLFPELGVDDAILEPSHWEHGYLASTLIAESPTEGAVGYLYFQVLGDVGYVRHVAVAKEARRRGVGRSLFDRFLAILRERDVSRFCLNVKPDNHGALALYAGYGMLPKYRSAVIRFPWALVEGLPPCPDAVARPLVPADEGALNLRFGLPSAQLSEARRLGRVLFTVTRGGDEALAAAAFDPKFPGAFPFRVADPDLAGPLLAALRPHALPHLPAMQVVLENDDALADRLVRRGGVRKLDVVHLEGTLEGPVPP